MWLRRTPHRINQWLPDEWLELNEDSLLEALHYLISSGQNWTNPIYAIEMSQTEKETSADLCRIACCLFWHVFDRPDQFTATQLEELKAAWRYQYRTDEEPVWVRAYVSIHTAGALAVHLHHVEGGYSEAVREEVDHITRLTTYLKSTDSLIRPGFYYADDPSYFNETVPLGKSLLTVCSLGWCFGFHIARADGKAEKAFDCAWQAFSIAEVAYVIHRFFAEPVALVEQENSTLGLVALWIGGHNIARVFDEIHLAVDPKVDWGELAFRCNEMSFYYQRALEWAEENRIHLDTYVSSDIGKLRSGAGSEWAPSYLVPEFLTYARGLCTTKLSPDAYRRLREEDEGHAARDRLRRYFFGDLWNELPSESQDALIAADKVFWSTEGRKGDILENLRLAVEPVVELRLLAPFRSWHSLKERQESSSPLATERNVFLRLSRLLKELWGDNQLFGEFTRTVFPDTPKAFWRDLRTALYTLRDLRSAAAHPDDRQPIGEDRISEQYRRFIGIGERGVIPQLIRLRPKQQ